MNKILAVWAVPRSTSTAFEWMMRQREDMTCFHEPFGEAWYQGEAPLWPRLTKDSLKVTGLTLGKEAVFIKDFPHYITSIIDNNFLDLFNHSFLIRDPAKTITSIYSKWPDFHQDEVGFKEQRKLFDTICDQSGTAPPVLDSDDLLENPYVAVERWCDAVGIAFVPQALSWAPGARDEVSWWDGGSFHANLRDSDGLKPQERKYIDISKAPDRVKRIYEQVLPHYEYLYSHRLILPANDDS